MKEQLYTIPVNDAFESDCECPLCKMKKDLERNAIEYTLGPSYMEDDNRAMTDETGFCEKHIQDLYLEKNRLGLALILSTHMQKTTRDLENLSKETVAGKSLFKKTKDSTGIGAYVNIPVLSVIGWNRHLTAISIQFFIFTKKTPLYLIRSEIPRDFVPITMDYCMTEQTNFFQKSNYNNS